MVLYIQKRLNIFVCIPSGAGVEGGGVGCNVSRQPSLTCRTSPPPYLQFLATRLNPIGYKNAGQRVYKKKSAGYE